MEGIRSDVRRPRPVKEPQRDKPRRFATPLGDFVAPLVEPVLAKQGFGEASLIADWVDIVGEAIGRGCRPIKLQWPPRAPKRDPESPPEPATLVLRVESGLALEIQHSALLIVERVNAHLGWRCVGKLAFRQGPVEAAPRRAKRCGPPSREAAETARQATTAIEADELREALTKLGARVIDGTRRKALSAKGVRR
jgi:hypothetical protein